MKIEEWKLYRRRDGKVVGPAMLIGGSLYGWGVDGLRYAASGSYLSGGPGTPFDLIEEVPAPVPTSALIEGELCGSPTTAAEIGGPWIKWTGGRCPVCDTALVDVQFRDGHTSNGAVAICLMWDASGGQGDIVAYRIHQPAAEPAPAQAMATRPFLELRTLPDTKVLTHGGEKTRRRLELRINGAVIDRFEEGRDDVNYYCGKNFDRIVLERVELFETALGIQAVRTVAPARSLMDDALMAALKERKAEAEARLARIEEIIAKAEGRS
ncbi:hypothetical protein [Prosthecomicrobium hirschii]|uniref:hypothetical protein n=1 Tax=Prosthecodimorpha hirschii TaxID=665126 RepID=UPI00221E5426|nr:hypothetical protein [Prosthecomicrobium hirschii]MCW1844193.1 hypothetical protein [Prosthecomicrobium hirschii]